MVTRDTRSPNDLGRIMDSMFRPREFPGARRGRVLIVLSVFLAVETAMLVNQVSKHQNATVAWGLWGLWTLVCVAYIFVPRLGAETDTDAARRVTIVLMALVAVIGLGVMGASVLLGAAVVWYWWVLVITTTVAVGGAHLGIRSLGNQE